MSIYIVLNISAHGPSIDISLMQNIWNFSYIYISNCNYDLIIITILIYLIYHDYLQII